MMRGTVLPQIVSKSPAFWHLCRIKTLKLHAHPCSAKHGLTGPHCRLPGVQLLCPAVPDAFLGGVLRCLVANDWMKPGTYVRCSQLHGPRAILIGDAAHAVAPRIGAGPCDPSVASALFSMLLVFWTASLHFCWPLLRSHCALCFLVVCSCICSPLQSCLNLTAGLRRLPGLVFVLGLSDHLFDRLWLCLSCLRICRHNIICPFVTTTNGSSGLFCLDKMQRRCLQLCSPVCRQNEKLSVQETVATGRYYAVGFRPQLCPMSVAGPGEGCNSAIEDGSVLERVLGSCCDDLDAAPAAFNATRLPDAQALYYLDYNYLVGPAAPHLSGTLLCELL